MSTVDTQPTLLKAVLTERHWQRYETFRAEYRRVAGQLAPELYHSAPSRAQYYRWITGQLKHGTPYPDACRVLEGMLQPWTADELFGPAPPNGLRRDGGIPSGGLLGAVPPSFGAEALAGIWVTSFTFSQPTKIHVDLAAVTADSDRQIVAYNYQPHTEGHRVAYRNEITAQLHNRHLIGHWKNSSDTRYFGGLHLAVAPGEVVMDGFYSGYGTDIEVSTGRWKWVRLDPASLADVDLEQITLLAPLALHKLIEEHSQYDAPLPLTAVTEEP